MRTVVLVIEHSEAGALGLVLNRPSETSVGEVVSELDGMLAPDQALWVGGPVAPSALIVLAEFAQPDDAALIAFADIGVLASESEDGPPEIRRGRAFVGHAGWGPGQLDAELASGDWFLEPALARGRVHRAARGPVGRRADADGRPLRARGADAAGSIGELMAAHDHDHAGHGHGGHVHLHGHGHGADRGALRTALLLIAGFMVAELAAGLLAGSLALLSDAAHMLTDAVALGVSLLAATLAARPARGAMTYGLGRAEILSAQANGVTLLILGVLIVVDGVRRLVSTPHVDAVPVLVLALVGAAVNLVVVRILAGDGETRSLNIEGSYRHILTDLFGFAATAVAAVVILATGFARADAIASLLIAALMLHAAYGLLIASGRVFMEAAPAGFDPESIGRALAAQPGVVEVHDLHVWEVTSGFPALSAHVVVRAGDDCHSRRRELQTLVKERFAVDHTTLQVDHEAAAQPPLQIEVPAVAGASAPRSRTGA